MNSDNEKIKQLCLSLLHADDEDAVVSLLRKAGYWDRGSCWRHFGDREDNFSVVGDQQSRPEAALVEKVVNSVDARLMDKCMISGFDPESSRAPQTIRGAVARFFEDREIDGEVGGKIRDWSAQRRREIADGITIAATGSRKAFCLTIADQGEGQTPSKLPVTILSLDKKNKLRIPFVQGKFNMGGTGVMRFCGKNSLQLVISKRNPGIASSVAAKDATASSWGFTVIRRQAPEASQKMSVFTYLAPTGADSKPGHGEVLQFDSPRLPLMPLKNQPYVREIEWGTAIKLYEYHASGFRSHILRKDGLLYRLEVLLPEIALPVRLHECRPAYGGEAERSYDTNLNGLLVRLEDGRHDNLEEGFPDSVQGAIHGDEKFRARIFAFRKGKAETYRKNEGILFLINGQTHGSLPTSFFSRDSVRMGRLRDSLLVVVDCTSMSRRTQEDLFMNSRDRLSGGDLRIALETELQQILREHEGLRALRERRKREEDEASLANSKPLEDILRSILKTSPSLSSLFITGQRLAIPHKTKEVAAAETPYIGKPHPTFFRFAHLDYGQVLKRNCPANRRVRVLFETDVVNDYFDRTENPGKFDVVLPNGDLFSDSVTHNLTLRNGRASLSISLPEDIHVGESLEFRTTLNDDTLIEPFVNVVRATIIPATEHTPGPTHERRPPSDAEGKGAEAPLGIELPKVIEVTQESWRDNKFDQYSACRIVQDESNDGKENVLYTFYVNIDNIYLQTEQKASKENANLLKAQFVHGTVLIGLALIRDCVERERTNRSREDGDSQQGQARESAEDTVARITRTLGAFVLPIIRSLGALTREEVDASSHLGDDE